MCDLNEEVGAPEPPVAAQDALVDDVDAAPRRITSSVFAVASSSEIFAGRSSTALPSARSFAR